MHPYPEAIDFLLSFADFERTGRYQRRPDIVPMQALLRALRDPHLDRRTIHVTGSKGKGSTAAMIESVLRASGLRTGLYTSPHLHDYTERVRVDGEPVSRETFARLTGQLRSTLPGVDIGDRKFITFDLLTALGFLAFHEADVDVQVMEVGLGGRLDSTNVFERKDVAVITPLSLEHTHVLGDSIEQIAAEKAAIIVSGCTAVLAPQAAESAESVVRARAESVGAQFVEVATEYEVCPTRQSTRIKGRSRDLSVQLPLLGRHQATNAATAAAAVDAFDPTLTDDALVRGLQSVRWPARVEVINQHPIVVADGAHNRDSARALREALVDFLGAQNVRFIVGSSTEKDISGLAEELTPIAHSVLAVRSSHPRTMDPSQISAAFRSLGILSEDVDTVPAAIERAMADAQSDALICLTGSLFVAAEGREYFGLD
jgi:dihydrofolate synthase/folylpolyglutamate synthase